MPISFPSSRPFAPLVLLAMSGVLLTACGDKATSARTTSPPPSSGNVASPSSEPDPGAQDLAAVRGAATAVEAAGSSSYELYLNETSDGDTGYVAKRTGRLVTSSGLHQVLLEQPDEAQGHEGQSLSLTFLYTPTQVLMDNANVSARTGKKWTRMPTAALQQYGADLDQTAHLPIGTVLDEARGPAQPVAPDEDSRAFTVQVPESAALPLAGVALASLQAEGLDIAGLPGRLTHDVALRVGMDAQGRLSRLSADVTQLYSDLATLHGKGPAPADVTIAAELYVSDVGSTTVELPPAATIADFPKNS